MSITANTGGAIGIKRLKLPPIKANRKEIFLSYYKIVTSVPVRFGIVSEISTQDRSAIGATNSYELERNLQRRSDRKFAAPAMNE